MHAPTLPGLADGATALHPSDETVDPIDPATLGVPVAYVVSTGDAALAPGEYGRVPRFPDRLGVAATEAPGSHEALFTEPAGPAQALLDA